MANDGAINYLEIHRCQELGEMRINVVARSAKGEAAADTTLTVVPMEDFRPGLKHVKRGAAFNFTFSFLSLFPFPSVLALSLSFSQRIRT